MKASDGSFVQGYNGQAAVDADSQIVVGADLTNQANDAPHLKAMLEQVCRNTGSTPREVSADAGYWSEGNVKAIEETGAEALVPPDKIPHRYWREVESPRGRIPKDATTEDLMRRKLRTKRGRERYRLRQMTAEPVFGHCSNTPVRQDCLDKLENALKFRVNREKSAVGRPWARKFFLGFSQYHVRKGTGIRLAPQTVRRPQGSTPRARGPERERFPCRSSPPAHAIPPG